MDESLLHLLQGQEMCCLSKGSRPALGHARAHTHTHTHTL